jgi:hypothetical protein
MSLKRRKSRFAFALGFLVLCAFISVRIVEAQKPIAAAHPRPFEPAEELFYDAEFNRSLLRGLDIGEFKLRSTRSPIITESDRKDGKPYSLIFSADVASKGFFTKLFNLKFHEQIESTVEATTFTLQKTTILDEQGKRVRATETTYDRSIGKMSWSQRDPNNPSAEPRSAVVDFSGQLQDVLSAIYFIRTQPLRVGQPFDIFIGESGRIHRVPVLVSERKSMKTVLGRVKVIRVEPQVFGADRLIRSENGQFTIWLTEDNRHIPVGARIKTEYGTFDIKLKRADLRDAR